MNEALRGQPKTIEYRGEWVTLRRPTVADLAEALHVNATAPGEANAWLLWRHLETRAGVQVFSSLEHAKACPLRLALRIVPMIEEMYGEGRD